VGGKQARKTRRRQGTLISSSQTAVRVPRKKIAELVSHVAAAEGARLGQIDVAVVGRRKMAGLNSRWLGFSSPTDVLSFDLSDVHSPGLSAQIVVCGETAAEQGRLRGTGPQRELLLYVVHGLLHLIGYEDTSVRGAAKMHARQEELLRAYLAPRGTRRRAGKK